MASAPLPNFAAPEQSPPRSDAPGNEWAMYKLVQPIGQRGYEHQVLGMRDAKQSDLKILERFDADPARTLMNLVAAMCDVSTAAVGQLHPNDFIMVAEDALWQVEQLRVSLGYAPRFSPEALANGERA